MTWTNAMVAAVLLRFLDPYTAVEQTDDPRIGASWASDPDHFPVPMGLADPLEQVPEKSLAMRGLGRLGRYVPGPAGQWLTGLGNANWMPTPRIVHARFKTYGEPPPEYDPEAPSPLFKVNQVGYLPWAPKYAYLGGWLGPSRGAWKPHGPLSGWQLVDAATGEVVKDSPEPPRLRVPDRTTGENGIPFTGEETFEMDFSDVVREGEYFLRVPDVGRSRTFRIRRGAAEDAFRVHMGGLYQKRCGIAKEEPYTHWTAGACHAEAVRGTFPPDEGTFSPKVVHFDIIRDNTDWARGERIHMPGGWHDAADYDRRPNHLSIVNDLCAVYLMRPRNFRDGQLAIPENANGIPDILDEAEWGLRHLLAGQQEDGGVGTWVESLTHPVPGNVAESDPMPYALSRATRRSSLTYAAHAALLARCDGRFREKYLASAIRAWDFALRGTPATLLYGIRHTDWPGIRSSETVYWDESPELPAEHLVKAAVNLHALTGEARYLEALEEDMPRLLEAQGRKGWAWNPLVFSGELAAGTPPELDGFFGGWTNRVRETADGVLRQMDANYAYRAPWRAPEDAWCHAMGWGNCHPLVRARWLVAADALFADPRYLDAISIANDFHNGCNPQGTTLTSGLGDVYPVAFLDLPSYVDGIAEYVPGITPFRWDGYALPWKAVYRVFGNDRAKASAWPVWRRWWNMEILTVMESEYTVSDTIGPAAGVTAYLTDPTGTPPPVRPEPAKALRDLEGYWLLP
ncbi:MAG: glycoside hydrolase family 9 protein [Kiritimatiellae bacterium]|nr:glycoside hydrolase family 9 protein [Kiritimatiellia bacterium]